MDQIPRVCFIFYKISLIDLGLEYNLEVFAWFRIPIEKERILLLSAGIRFV